MEEVSKNSKYIICSKCKCKYINDEEHINKDFGYTILEEKYKTCVRRRARGKMNDKTYYDKHQKQIKQYYEDHKEERKHIFLAPSSYVESLWRRAAG